MVSVSEALRGFVIGHAHSAANVQQKHSKPPNRDAPACTRTHVAGVCAQSSRVLFVTKYQIRLDETKTVLVANGGGFPFLHEKV